MSKSEKKNGSMSFLQHLEEFRWHIVRSVIALLLFAIIAFIFKNIIFDKIILAPKSSDFITNRLMCKFGSMINVPNLCINTKPLNLINLKMTGQFMTHIKISLIAGLILAVPYIIWELWRFISPALYPKEKRHAGRFVIISSFLFMLGVLFGYYIIVPLSLDFLNTYMVSEEITNRINLDSYISIINSVSLSSGVVFELPVIIYFLSKLGLVGPEFLKKYRRHAIVLILLLAAIITPPDLFSQILVSIPLIILYEVSIGISKRIAKKRLQKSN